MSQPLRYRLTKNDKLKSRKAIEHLFANGKSFSLFPFRVVWELTDADEGLKAGVSASSRSFKKATDRNRVKRLMREAYRLSKNDLSLSLKDNDRGMKIFFLFQGRELPEYHLLKEKMEAALKKLIKLSNGKTETAT
ncbi:MAG: ribonuclease P protein component [Ferruginibacter sp.]